MFEEISHRTPRPIVGRMHYVRVGQGLREVPPAQCVRPTNPHDLRGKAAGRVLITWDTCHQLRGYVCLACDRETPEFAEWCVGPAQFPLLPGEPETWQREAAPPACGHPVLDAHPGTSA